MVSLNFLDLIIDILSIVNLIFNKSMYLSQKDFISRMMSLDFKFTCFLLMTHKTFQSKNECFSLKKFENNTF